MFSHISPEKTQKANNMIASQSPAFSATTDEINEKDDYDEQEENEDKELIAMLELDANNVPAFSFKTDLKPEAKRSIKIESEEFYKQRLSLILGDNEDGLVKFQNYMME